MDISRIIETHNHADRISGTGRLAQATGAAIHISEDAGVDYEHEPLSDGEEIELGVARREAIATLATGPSTFRSRCGPPPAPRIRGS